MASQHSTDRSLSNAEPPLRGNEIMSSLVSIASTAANAQIGMFTVRFADALHEFSDASGDGKEASLSFNVANVLKKNSYAYYHIVSALLEQSLQNAVLVTENPSHGVRSPSGDEQLSLVSYEEVDKELLLGKMSRPLDLANSDALAALGIRIGHLLGVEDLTLAQNPFRPEVFMKAFHEAWCEFSPEEDAHYLMLPLLRPDIFIDLTPIIKALNDEMIACGILPQLSESFRIRKSNTVQDNARKHDGKEPAIVQQLRNLFSPQSDGSQGSVPGNGFDAVKAFSKANGFDTGFQEHVFEAATASNKLLGYLAGVQKNGFMHHAAGGAIAAHPHSQSVLSSIKAQAPQGAFSRVDENTIDLLTKIFDVVFRDQNIPQEIKALIGFLQVPVLKAALVDKEFFFNEEHPARRVIDMLSKSGVGWDQEKGHADPLYQTIKRNVERIQQDFDQEGSVFTDVIADLQSFIETEETQAVEALSAPITVALRQEKIGQATKVAKHDVDTRIGTGEVVPFVESFLEQKWVSVLAIAYTVRDEKPQVVASAVKTMDDLIWSVKPKITMQERKELISRLPTMLAALNKWLNIVKWDDADRLQFFADLAECHASIVRAPIEMSPQRQLEIAIEVSKQAAERRLQKREAEEQQPETIVDHITETVDKLERSMWLGFQQQDKSVQKVKLAWVSPLRTLFIFATSEKKEAFSMSAEELVRLFRDDRVEVLATDGLIGRALAEAMESVGANDDSMESQTAA